MPLPINMLDIKEEASGVVQLLRNVNNKATNALLVKNHDVINLYYTLLKTASKFSDLGDRGFTIEVLGPELGLKLGIDWTMHEAEFTLLKDTYISNFITCVLTNQVEICAHTLSTNSVEYLPISEPTKSELLVHILNIKDIFGS